MNLAKTIRLDISDANIFPNPAEPGEWAVTGTFSFVDIDLGELTNKEKIAHKSGWLGLDGFGRSTLVCVTMITEAEYQLITRQLAEYLFRQFGAPDMLVALDAARQEIDDMVALCNHPTGSLLAIGREAGEAGIIEQVRKIENPDGDNHARIWDIEPEDT